jgi:membrane-associated phospholipid phosphatase
LDQEKNSKTRWAVSKLKIEAAYASVRRRRWREDGYVLLPLCYAIALLGYYIAFGRLLEFLPAVFFLAAIPVMAVLGLKGVAKYWVPFVMIVLSYEALQGVIGGYSATIGIYSLAGVDESLWGFNLTGWVQSTFLSLPLTDVMTVFYELQMPLMIFAAALLWYWRRRSFGQYVTAVALTSYSALITFILIPTAPPWFVGSARDLVLGAGQAASSGLAGIVGNLIVSDKFAAFPSLHAAFAVIFSYFMIKADRRLALVALPVTAAILFSTIYLGQHYMIDIIGGVVYALVPCVISERHQLFTVS